MKMRFVITALSIVIALPLLGQDDPEVFRGDLLRYVDGLSRLPPELIARYDTTSNSLLEARASIGALSHDELRELKRQLDRVPFWRDVPAMVAYSIAQPGGVPGPRDIAAALTTGGMVADVETARKSLLAFIQAFKNIPAEKVDPQYRARIARVEQHIAGATPQQLAQLHRDLQARMPEWTEQLAAAGKQRPPAPSTGRAPRAEHHGCGHDFGGIICDINNIINSVTAFFNDIPGFATNALNNVINIFTGLVAAVPTSLDALIAEFGITGVNFTAAAQAAQGYAHLPCPADGTVIPGIGTVGSITAWANHAKGVGFAGNTLQDIAPGDIITGLNAEAFFALVNFPVQWLGSCLEGAWQDAYDEAQADHRDLVSQRLDVVASTRATQTSVNTTQSQTSNIDGDVARLEGKVDVLNTTTARTEATTNRIIATTDATESNANRLETTSVRLDTTATRVEGKVANLQAQQAQTSLLLQTMQSDYLRMLIENDLLRQANTRISLFQLPAAAGGLLELVQSHVVSTVGVRESAGVDVKASRKALADATAALTAGNYKSAYSLFRTAYQRAVN